MTMKLERESLAPDVFVRAADKFYGIWYGINATRGVVEIASTTLGLPTEEIRLRPGTVATLVRTLTILPSVHISLRAPPGAFEGLEKSIDVLGSAQQLLRRVELHSTEARAEYLPAEQLRVALRIGHWCFVQEIDLSGFQDQDVVFDLQPIVVNGKVYRGSNPVAGELRFSVGPEWVQTTTDDQGQYQITLWEPRSYVVEIQPRNDKAPHFREYFVEILHSQTRDFRIPDNNYAVHVTDAGSGEPIAGAEVGATNTFRDGEGPEQRTAHRAITDKDGNALLAALRPGSVSVVASAKGYFDSNPTEVPVGQGTDLHTIPIQLHAEDETAQLVLRLSNGEPCAGAEVVAVPNDLRDTILWRSSTEADGAVKVPKRLRGTVLLARHPGGGALARLWDGSDPGANWQLPDRTSPLVIKVTDAAGNVARFADVTLWVDGIPLRGYAVRFLTGSPAVTDRDGFWRGLNLGGQAIEVLVMRRFRPPLLRTLAQRVDFPWPNPFPVRVIE